LEQGAANEVAAPAGKWQPKTLEERVTAATTPKTLEDRAAAATAAPKTLEERATAAAAAAEIKAAEAAAAAVAKSAEDKEEEKKKPANPLHDPDWAEDTVCALLCSKTDAMVQHGGDTPKEIVAYARKWLGLVADEFHAEVNEGLVKRPRGTECTIECKGAVKDTARALWLSLDIKEVESEDEPDPTATHALFLTADGGTLFYISYCSPIHRGQFRAIAIDAEALRDKNSLRVARHPPRGKVKAVELASASTALQRVHALCSVSKLDPGLATGLGILPASTGAAASLPAAAHAAAPEAATTGSNTASPWHPLDETQPLVQAQLRRLNPSQRLAITKLDGPATLVQGPPGTGKSTFITAVCLTRVPPGARILVCTSTNKAIDSLVMKLESADFPHMLCVGSKRAMGDASRRHLMSSVLARDVNVAEAEASNSKKHLVDELKSIARHDAWSKVRLVACTASSALQISSRLQKDLAEAAATDTKRGRGSKPSAAEKAPLVFEFVILDEAAAMLEPDAIGCLLHGAKAVLLVGDHQQLPPFSKWRDAATKGYTVSLMGRLATRATTSTDGMLINKPTRGGGAMPPRAGSSGALAELGGPKAPGAMLYVLTEQFRMHPAINNIVSTTFYHNKIKTAAITTRERQHPMPVAFCDVVNGREEVQNGASCFNPIEAAEVATIVEHCVRYLAFAMERVNVITFYNAQRDLIEKLLKRAGLADVAVLSVDSMQGREADLVVLSTVRATGGFGLGFVADARRANVALSRARESMIVVGSVDALRVERIWHSAIKGMQVYCGSRELISAVEATLPPGWAMPRAISPNFHQRRAERTSGDSAFSSEAESPEPGHAPKWEKMEQRDSNVADDWDASSDEDEADEAVPVA